jgi:membrane associated rhomboid family serine protease
MFEDIKKDQNRKPILTYFIAIVSALITLATIVFPDLYNVFGSLGGNISIFKIFSLPFQHGFDRITAIALLVLLLFFWVNIASFVEKIIGPERFTYLVTLVIVLSGVTQFFTGQPGHGLSPLIFAMIPVLFAAMREVVDIKIGNSYDKVYKFLRVLTGTFVLITIVFHSFAPIYFSYNMSEDFNKVKKTTVLGANNYDNPVKTKKSRNTQIQSFDGEGPVLTLLKNAIFGNLFHVLGLLIGLSFAVKFKKRMGGTFTRFNKRKEFSEKDSKQAYIFIILTSGYLVGLLIISFFIEL